MVPAGSRSYAWYKARPNSCVFKQFNFWERWSSCTYPLCPDRWKIIQHNHQRCRQILQSACLPSDRKDNLPYLPLSSASSVSRQFPFHSISCKKTKQWIINSSDHPTPANFNTQLSTYQLQTAPHRTPIRSSSAHWRSTLNMISELLIITTCFPPALPGFPSQVVLCFLFDYLSTIKNFIFCPYCPI